MNKIQLGAALLTCTGLTAPVLAQDSGYLGEVTLSAESDTTIVQDGYIVSSGRQATKVNAPLKTIPQAISTVTVKQIEDQKPRSLNETLTYTASADPYSFGYDTRFDAFNLRGFPAFYDGVFRDGLRQYNAPTALFKHEPYGLEAITILKGPASSLYGASGPGGIANMVSKRPKDTPFRELKFGLGEHNRREVGIDLSGPADKEGRVRYRLTGLLRDSDTHLDGFKDDKRYFAPALSFDLGEDTTVTLLAEWSRSVTGGTAGYYTDTAGKLTDLYQGDPDYNDFTQDQRRFGYEVEHRFTDDLVLRQQFRHTRVEADLQYSGYYSVGLPNLFRYWGHYAEEMTANTLDTQLQVNAQTGAVSHEILLGFDITQSEYSSASAIGYQHAGASAASVAAMPMAFAGSLKMDQRGLYLHDQMTWGNWAAFASVRHDIVEVDALSAGGARFENRDTGTSARLGLSYTLDNGVTVYGNVASSFLPVPQLVYSDITLPAADTAGVPTTSVQQEIGIKYELPEANSLITASIFNIDAKNQLILDASTGPNKARQVDLNSRGIELEAAIDFQNGWSMLGSLTYQEVSFAKDDPNFAGKRLNAVPETVAALWGKYDFRDGPLKGLGIGAGLRYVGKSYGDDANTIKNTDKLFVDMGVSYDFQNVKGMRLQANVRNVFDNRQITCASSTCYRDEGRFVSVDLVKRF